MSGQRSEAFCSLRMSFFKGTTGRALAGFLQVNFWWIFQVLLPLVDQYFTNHRLYFLSSPLKPLSSGGSASHKEKEMVARWVCKGERRSWCWCETQNSRFLETKWVFWRNELYSDDQYLRGFDDHLGLESKLIHTCLYVIILATKKSELFGGFSRAGGKIYISGQLLCWNNI